MEEKTGSLRRRVGNTFTLLSAFLLPQEKTPIDTFSPKSPETVRDGNFKYSKMPLWIDENLKTILQFFINFIKNVMDYTSRGEVAK